MLLETLIMLLETLIMLLETLIMLLETLIMLLETLIMVLKKEAAHKTSSSLVLLACCIVTEFTLLGLLCQLV